jgi:hypothetical protein
MYAQETSTTSTSSTKTTYNGRTYVVSKEKFPAWSIAPYGGAIFPVARLSEGFKPNGAFGLDIGAKINKEIGFYGRFGYYFMNSQQSTAPVGKYMELTVGPRYYFSSANIKSKLFLDAGVGAYIFNQASFVDPNDPTQAIIPQINETRAGINAGVGASIYLSEAINLMVRTKYNSVFTPNGTSSFLTAASGIEFKF